MYIHSENGEFTIRPEDDADRGLLEKWGKSQSVTVTARMDRVSDEKEIWTIDIQEAK